jgi:hypothetical protein
MNGFVVGLQDRPPAPDPFALIKDAGRRRRPGRHRAHSYSNGDGSGVRAPLRTILSNSGFSSGRSAGALSLP